MQATNAGRTQEVAVGRAPTRLEQDEDCAPKPPSGACSLCCQSQPCRLALIVLGTLLIVTGFAGIALSVTLNRQDSTASFGLPVSGVAIFVGIVLIFCSYGLKVQLKQDVTESHSADRNSNRRWRVTVGRVGGSSVTSNFEMSQMSAEAVSAARQRMTVMQGARAVQLSYFRHSNAPARPAAASAVGEAPRLSSVSGVLQSPSADNLSTAAVGSQLNVGRATEEAAQSTSYHFHSASLDQFQPTLVLHHGLVSEREAALNAEAPSYASVVLLPAELSTAAARLSDSSSQLPLSQSQALPLHNATLPAPSYEQALLISEPVAVGSRERETSSSIAVATVEPLSRSGAPPLFDALLLPPPSYDEVYS